MQPMIYGSGLMSGAIVGQGRKQHSIYPFAMAGIKYEYI